MSIDPGTDHVSLYSLGRSLRLHRDVLQRLCRRHGIGILRVPVSTPRYLVRAIAADDVPALVARAKAHPRRRRRAKPSACGARLHLAV